MTAQSLVVPLIVVIWWVALWGLTDALMSGWSKSRRVTVYGGLLLLSLYAIYSHPPLIERL